MICHVMAFVEEFNRARTALDAHTRLKMTFRQRYFQPAWRIDAFDGAPSAELDRYRAESEIINYLNRLFHGNGARRLWAVDAMLITGVG